MKINKLFNSVNDVMSDVFDGAVIMLGGFGEAGSPVELIHGLIDTKCKDLTIIANNAGNGKIGSSHWRKPSQKSYMFFRKIA